MRTENISADTLKVIKCIMFGNQKQASVINDSVALLAAEALARYGFSESEYSSGESFDRCVRKMLEDAVNGLKAIPDSDVLILCGRQSLANYKSGGPISLVVNNPIPGSPKITYRIAKFGEDAEIEEEVQVASTSEPVAAPATDTFHRDETYRERAERLKNSILPTVPSAIKEEISDNEYAQCLCVAEHYFAG